MGNQNNTPKSNMKRSTPTINRTPNRFDSAQQQQQPRTIDLDEIVEQWVWHMWNRTKTKSLSYYKREELLVKINWKRVVFVQNQAQFSGSPPVHLPQSQILFRTKFNNKTTNEQSYVFKTERFTRSTFKFSFTQSLTKTQESAVIFRLPEEIVEVGGGIKREQSVEFGQDTTKEYDMRWSVNSQIRVAPHTCMHAELNIDEAEFNGDFSVCIRFFGRITVTIATRQEPDTYLKFMEGDIVQIIREHMENNRRLNGLEILEENPPIARFTMRGKCSFRYGIQQHVKLNQESLDLPQIPSLLIPNYRPLRPHLTSSNSNIHLKIIDDDDDD